MRRSITKNRFSWVTSCASSEKIGKGENFFQSWFLIELIYFAIITLFSVFFVLNFQKTFNSPPPPFHDYHSILKNFQVGEYGLSFVTQYVDNSNLSQKHFLHKKMINFFQSRQILHEWDFVDFFNNYFFHEISTKFTIFNYMDKPFLKSLFFHDQSYENIYISFRLILCKNKGKLDYKKLTDYCSSVNWQKLVEIFCSDSREIG